MKKYNKIQWTKFDKFLGTMSDEELSNIIGCTRSSVGKRREKLDIQRYAVPIPRNEIIYCKCGCGQTLQKYDGRRKREYLPSHWSKTQQKQTIKVQCFYCGKEIEKTPYKFNKVNRHFCNRECCGKYMSEKDLRKNKNNGHYNTITVPCSGCGNPVSKAKSLIERRNNRVYCKDCIHLVKQGRKGFYIGYPKEFSAPLRYRVRKRDKFVCQLCNTPQSDKTGTLHVHHIDYDKNNNSLQNLITLCRTCHGKTNFGTHKWQDKFTKLMEDKYS